MRCYCFAQSKRQLFESHINFFPAVNTKNKYCKPLNFFLIAMRCLIFFISGFWTLLKATESWCFKAFKSFVLLFYDNLEAEQNFQHPVSKPLLLFSCILKLFDPLAARPLFSWTLSILFSVTCGTSTHSLCPVFHANLETPLVLFLSQKNLHWYSGLWTRVS